MRKPGGCGFKKQMPTGNDLTVYLVPLPPFLDSWRVWTMLDEVLKGKKKKCFALFIGCLSCQMMLYVENDVNTPLKCISYKSSLKTIHPH